MGAIFQQTDTAAACGSRNACSGRTLANVTDARKAIEGGVSGVNTVSVTIPPINGSPSYAAIMFELVPGAAYSQWAAGNYTVQLNITQSAGFPAPKWEDTWICRLNSGCTSLETIGSKTAQGITVTTGILSMIVAGSLVAAPAATDKIYIVLTFSSTTTQTFTYQPFRLIFTPIVASSGVPPRRRRIEGY